MKQNYDDVFEEILTVVSNGNTALKVMEVLKERGIVEGEPTKSIEWIFNFNNGGWNTVMAVGLAEAQLRVMEEYSSLNPNLASLRPSTEPDYQAHLRNFD